MRNGIVALIIGAVVVGSAVGLYCYGEREIKIKGSKGVMGTYAEVIVVTQSRERGAAEGAIEDAFEEMDRVNNLFSRHDPASPLSILNDNNEVNRSYFDENKEKYGENGWGEFTWVLNQSINLYELTDSAFDITIKPILDLYHNGISPTQEEINHTLEYVNIDGVKISDDNVKIRGGMGLTLDGIAKGYGVDKASEVLTQRGFRDHSVEIGGEVKCSGLLKGEKWKVGVVDPSEPDSTYKTIEISDLSVATSGQYYQWHIINPKTGLYVEGSGSVTIMGQNCTYCDALATALFVLGFDEGVDNALEVINNFEGFDCFIILDNRTVSSPGLQSPPFLPSV